MALAPCPFCRSTQCHSFECDIGLWAVYCPSCQTIGPQAKSTQEAEHLWNLAVPRGEVRPHGPGHERED